LAAAHDELTILEGDLEFVAREACDGERDA
jgi:hypothetical protein